MENRKLVCLRLRCQTIISSAIQFLRCRFLSTDSVYRQVKGVCVLRYAADCIVMARQAAPKPLRVPCCTSKISESMAIQRRAEVVNDGRCMRNRPSRGVDDTLFVEPRGSDSSDRALVLAPLLRPLQGRGMGVPSSIDGSRPEISRSCTVTNLVYMGLHLENASAAGRRKRGC